MIEIRYHHGSKQNDSMCVIYQTITEITCVIKISYQQKETIKLIDLQDQNAKTQLKDLLKEGLVTVTFIKKNGENRIMTCTLNQDIIPQTHLPKLEQENVQPKARNDNNISVWDVNVGGWRSFIWQNVTAVTAVEKIK
jgi:DNA-binding MarR family transcriptional regulator